MYNVKYDRCKIRISNLLGDGSALFAGLFLCAATFCMFVNMMTRTFIDHNFQWIYDFCGLCAAGIAAYSIPYTTFVRGHSNMDIILSKCKPRTRGMSEGISGIITIAVMVFTIFAVTKIAIMKTLALELTTSAHLPTFVFRWLYIIGLVLTTFAAVLEMIDMFRVAFGKNVLMTQEEIDAYENGTLNGTHIFESETERELEAFEAQLTEEVESEKVITGEYEKEEE